MASQTRLPPISRLLIPPCDLIFLRRLPALFSRYSGTSEAAGGRQDLDDLGAGRRPVGHEVAVGRSLFWMTQGARQIASRTFSLRRTSVMSSNARRYAIPGSSRSC